MIRIAIGYVTLVVLCAVLILLNPMDFMGQNARDARLKAATEPAQVLASADPAESLAGDPLAGSIAATTAAILADLTAAAEARGDSADLTASADKGEDALARMSAAVVSGLRGDSAQPTVPADDATLETLVAQALREGQTDSAIDAIVNQAVAEGTIEAPAMLRTTEGKVDTAVLLASILAEAQGEEFGQGDLSEPTEVIDEGTPSMQAATEDVLYVVRAGDSLGALALRFYGDADLNGAIFKANRQVLDTPESLRLGMKLLIPAKSGL